MARKRGRISHQQDDFTDNDPGIVFWTCTFCGKNYKSEAWYRKHLTSQHGEGSEAAVGSFPSTSDFAQHPRTEQPHVSLDAPFVHAARVNSIKTFSTRPPLAFPFISRSEWDYHNSQIDIQLGHSLPVSSISEENIEDQLEFFDDFVYNYFYGVFRSYQSNGYRHAPNRHNSFKSHLRKRKRDFRHQLRQAKLEGNDLKCRSLARAYRSLLKLIQQISRQQAKTQEEFLYHKNESEFDKNPFRYSKSKLDSSPRDLNIKKEDALNYFETAYRDLQRGAVPLDMFAAPKVSSSHQLNPPNPDEIAKILKKTGNKSAPGPNGLPYLVYKNCVTLQSYLCRFFKIVWASGNCPSGFGRAVVKLIPKEDGCDHPSKARPIALLNTHGKVFSSVISRRLYAHLERNNFLKPNCQKGFTSGVSGCLEHTEVLTEALKDARRHERQIFITWLDLGNAFGSVKHNLLQYALHHYSVPYAIRRFIFSYYDLLCFRVKSGGWETNALPYEKGLFQGCPLSPIAFNSVFSMILDKLDEYPQSGRYRLRTGSSLPAAMAFADDLTLICRTPKALYGLLKEVEGFCRWSGCLSVKPSKCRYLALARKGSRFGPISLDIKIDEAPVQQVVNTTPFKFLGKFLQWQGRPDPDTAIEKSFASDIAKVNNLPLSGPRKAWIYNNLVLARLSWPLLIYDISKGMLDSMEKQATAVLKRWLGLHRSMDTSMLYRSEGSFGFGLKRISTTYKQFRITKSNLLAKSKDPLVVDVTSHSRQDLSELQAQVAFNSKFLSGVNWGRQGLGFIQPACRSSESSQMREIVQKEEDHNSFVRAQQLEVQNDWTIVGEVCIPPKLQWRAFLYEWTPEMVKFYGNALQGTLPSPSNLARWNITPENACSLCNFSPASALHILAGCPKALKEGRFTWRHDKVLVIIRESISYAIAVARRTQSSNRNSIKFVKAGQQPSRSQTRTCPSIISKASDWKICMDSGNRHFEFPPDIVVTSLCPDVVAFSKEQKQVLILELTVPWETNIPSQHQYKTNKYQALCSAVRQKGYCCYFYAVEVGVRGLPAKSLHFFFKELGLGRKKLNDFMRRISKASLEASYRLWLRRSYPWENSGEGRVVAT